MFSLIDPLSVQVRTNDCIPDCISGNITFQCPQSCTIVMQCSMHSVGRGGGRGT